MTFQEIKTFLLDRDVPPNVAQIYASAMTEYCETLANIQKTGCVVANPRTGAPMDNPYLGVRDAVEKKLTTYSTRRIPCIPELWELIFPSSTPTTKPKSTKPKTGGA